MLGGNGHSNSQKNEKDWFMRLLAMGALAALGFGAVRPTNGVRNVSPPPVMVQLTLPPEFKALAASLPERIRALEVTVSNLDKNIDDIQKDVRSLLIERRNP